MVRVAGGVAGVAFGVRDVASGAVPPAVLGLEGAGLAIAGSEPFLPALPAITGCGCAATGAGVGPEAPPRGCEGAVFAAEEPRACAGVATKTDAHNTISTAVNCVSTAVNCGSEGTAAAGATRSRQNLPEPRHPVAPISGNRRPPPNVPRCVQIIAVAARR